MDDVPEPDFLRVNSAVELTAVCCAMHYVWAGELAHPRHRVRFPPDGHRAGLAGSMPLSSDGTCCLSDILMASPRPEGWPGVVDSRSAAKLKVRFAPAFLSFLPAVWGDYWVVGLAPDYSWGTVGSPDRKYLWVLGRTSSIGTEAYAAALEAARSSGFDVVRLIRTAQGGPAK